MIRDNNFPSKVIEKRQLLIAFLLTQLNLRSYDYVLDIALTFYRYLKTCKGKYAIPSLRCDDTDGRDSNYGSKLNSNA